jgi:osmotically-inducible protein OsmY
MRRITVCAVMVLSSALAFGEQQPPYPGQTLFATLPAMYPGDASQQQEQSQNQSELREAVRACAALLVAATSVSCPGDASQRQAQLPQQPPPPPANPQEKSGGNSQIQSDLRGALRACAALLVAATSVSCPGDTSQQQTQQQQQLPQPPASLQDKSGVNSQIQSNLRSDLKSDPGLSGTDVETTVDDVNITLTGTVQSQAQLDRVMALASPYASYRKLVNKVTVK